MFLLDLLSAAMFLIELLNTAMFLLNLLSAAMFLLNLLSAASSLAEYSTSLYEHVSRYHYFSPLTQYHFFDLLSYCRFSPVVHPVLPFELKSKRSSFQEWKICVRHIVKKQQQQQKTV